MKKKLLLSQQFELFMKDEINNLREVNGMVEKAQILNEAIPNIETELTFLKEYIPKLVIYEKEEGKWYIKSHDLKGKRNLPKKK